MNKKTEKFIEPQIETISTGKNNDVIKTSGGELPMLFDDGAYLGYKFPSDITG